jgi:hypothetical protein
MSEPGQAETQLYKLVAGTAHRDSVHTIKSGRMTEKLSKRVDRDVDTEIIRLYQVHIESRISTLPLNDNSVQTQTNKGRGLSPSSYS